MSGAKRIVCLTEETTETLYLIGESQRIVGISGFTVRPPAARREKPRVSAFTSARIDRIIELRPDLVLAFSDLQADIAASLVRAGLSVHVFNQRSIEEILEVIRTLGRLVDAAGRADALAAALEEEIDAARKAAESLARRPRVYFEEWDEPMISGIRWVSELIRVAGGDDCFPELALRSLGRERIIEDPARVVEAAPDIIIASWCGKKFRPEHMRRRPGWEAIPALRDGELHEIKSSIILQPGPAALGDGLAAIRAIISGWAQRRQESVLGPGSTTA